MSARLLDSFDQRLRLEGVLATRTGLHIGAGSSGDPLATDSPVVRNASGAPYIPGSSLKGVVRSAAEALFRNTMPLADADEVLASCDHIAGKPCVTHDDLTGFREDHPEDSQAVAEAIWAKSCTVCRLFGSLAIASRVRFPDLPLVGGAPLLELRNGVGIDRDKELAASGVLYDFEAVPPETPFQLTVILDNYTDWEVGLVLYLFEQLDQGGLALGGKTSRGLGQVRIDWQKIDETSLEKGNPFADLLSTRELLSPDEETATESTEKELPLPTTGNVEDWQTLATILRALPAIDKTQLGKQAGKQDFVKPKLSDRLGLGLESPRQKRRAWDVVLQRFVDSGFLVEKNGRYLLAEDSLEEAAPEEQELAEHNPVLQKLYDRYVGAMAQLWEATY